MNRSRRQFLKFGSLALATGMPPCLGAAEAPVVTGIGVAFDREMEAFMAARKVPGGALAVAKDGRLVHARGYGWAHREAKIPARADSLFRIASLSKPITAVAVLKLIESGKLTLDTCAIPLLGLTPLPETGLTPDPRLQTITIRQLLQHTGGWDRDKSFDPMFRSDEIARITGRRPAGPVDVIRYMLSRPLDFEPGTRYAYSNFGYCLLGRVIEKLSGKTYEEHVRREVLRPAGIRRMQIGRSLDGRQAEGEVRYYTGDAEPGGNVFPEGPEKVPWPYGGFHLEAMDAHGGWIASAVDLMRFVVALDDGRRGSLLKPASLASMLAPPPAPVARKPDGSVADRYYGCGWSVRPVGAEGRVNYWHTGSLPGTNTLLVRLADGLAWAALFNLRSEDKSLPDGEIDAALHRAAAAVDKWPTKDLFKSFR